MVFRSLALVSFAALGAAFLVPSTFSDDARPELTRPLGLNPNEELIEIGCPGCYFPEKTSEDSYIWTEGVENSLVLNISTARGPDTSLFINGVKVFPALEDAAEPIVVYQKRAGEPLAAFESSLKDRKGLIVGSEIAWTVTPSSDFENVKDITNVVKFHFKVTSLNGVGVTGLDSLEMTLAELPEEFLITSVDLQPTTAFGASPTEQEKAGEKKECATFPLLCKWKAIIAEKIHNAKNGLRKGCMGRPRPHQPKPEKHTPHPDEHSNQGEPPAHYVHGHHDYHREHRQGFAKVVHVLKRIAVHVIVPVFIGIIAGMTASLIGMILGQLAVMMWRRFYRCRQNCRYTPVSQSTSAERDVAEEEKELLNEDLPEYAEYLDQDAPVEKQ